MFDAAAAADATSFLSIAGLLKAMPVEDGGGRFLFIEASNENVDFQGEIVLAKALHGSAEEFRRRGNIDLEHRTVIGPTKGPADYPLWEIGLPVQVECRPGRTFVKAELYQGDTPVATNANIVWDSLTKLRPAQRWFPSVGGQVLERQRVIGPDGIQRTLVTKTLWTNIGLSKQPVNRTVPSVSTVPIGPLAKCWTAAGLDLAKALDMSGAGSDVAGLSGGAALQRQGLDRRVQSYFDYRERMAKAVRAGGVPLNARAMAHHGRSAFGLDDDTAAEWAGRMLAGLPKRPTLPQHKETPDAR